MSDTPILIIGGAGKTGLRVKKLFEAQGHDVRAAARICAGPCVPEEVPARDFADYARETAATGAWRV